RQVRAALSGTSWLLGSAASGAGRRRDGANCPGQGAAPDEGMRATLAVCGSLRFRVPLLHRVERPLRGLVGVASVATVGVAVLERVRWGDELERVVAGLGDDRVGARLRHVALDAAAAGTRCLVVGVLGEHLVFRPRALLGTVAGQTQGVGVGGLD